MALISAHRRAKRLGLDKLDEGDIKNVVLDYLQKQDSRPVMWTVERAMNATVDSLEEAETTLMLAERFKPVPDEVNFKEDHDIRDAKANIERYKEDFEFLYCLHKMISNMIMEMSVNDFAEYVASKYGKKRGRSAKTVKPASIADQTR